MLSQIHCRYAALDDVLGRDPAAAHHWLSSPEQARYSAIRCAQRQRTWLAGRIAAKRLLLAALAAAQAGEGSPAEVTIESADARSGQRPTIFAGGNRLDWALSISHTDRGVLVALSAERQLTLGVDLVVDGEARQLDWCFTPRERDWLAGGASAQPRAEQLWARKEALYKACQQGEGFDPRQFEVVPGRDPHYAELHAQRRVRRLQSWRVDGQAAALAIVEPAAVVDTAVVRVQTVSPLGVLC